MDTLCIENIKALRDFEYDFSATNGIYLFIWRADRTIPRSNVFENYSYDFEFDDFLEESDADKTQVFFTSGNSLLDFELNSALIPAFNLYGKIFPDTQHIILVNSFEHVTTDTLYTPLMEKWHGSFDTFDSDPFPGKVSFMENGGILLPSPENDAFLSDIPADTQLAVSVALALMKSDLISEFQEFVFAGRNKRLKYIQQLDELIREVSCGELSLPDKAFDVASLKINLDSYQRATCLIPTFPDDSLPAEILRVVEHARGWSIAWTYVMSLCGLGFKDEFGDTAWPVIPPECSSLMEEIGVLEYVSKFAHRGYISNGQTKRLPDILDDDLTEEFKMAVEMDIDPYADTKSDFGYKQIEHINGFGRWLLELLDVNADTRQAREKQSQTCDLVHSVDGIQGIALFIVDVGGNFFRQVATDFARKLWHLPAIANLAGAVPEGYAKAVVLTKRFVLEHLDEIASGIESGQAVIVYDDSGIFGDIGRGLPELLESKPDGKIGASDSLEASPGILSIIFPELVNAEVVSAAKHKGIDLIDAFEYGFFPVLSNGISKYSTHLPWNPHRLDTHVVIPTPEIRLLQKSTRYFNRDKWTTLLDEYKDLLDIWTTFLGKLGLCLRHSSVITGNRVWKALGEATAADSAVEAYYAGVPAEDLF